MRYLLLIVALVAAGCSKPVPPVAKAVASQSETDLAACRAAIKATLIDPESVRFSEEVCWKDDPDERACNLTFNAKNRYGGYVGRKPQGCWLDGATGRVKQLT